MSGPDPKDEHVTNHNPQQSSVEFSSRNTSYDHLGTKSLQRHVLDSQYVLYRFLNSDRNLVLRLHVNLKLSSFKFRCAGRVDWSRLPHPIREGCTLAARDLKVEG